MSQIDLFPPILQAISSLNPDCIAPERITVLQPLIHYIQTKLNSRQPINLNFICTHNSRRSHLTQAWAQVMASHFGLKDLRCYSGGTESTALYHATADALRRSGFEILALSEGPNPVYAIKFGENIHPIIGFSKRFDHPFNPKSEFAAIMTCSDADKGCPYVEGAESYIAVTYEDPKVSDGTPRQADVYHSRSLQIATEMMYVFSQIIKP